jgi:CRP-like cAMP-binding protein
MTICIDNGYTSLMDRPTSADLGSLPLFGGLSADALGCLATRCHVEQIAEGDVVFREGDRAQTLYVLHSGHLEVFKRRDDTDIVLGEVGPGECVGEMSFIDMQPRSATVRATKPSELWVWSYQSIHERYCADQKCAMLLVMNIARELSRRLRRADEVIVLQGPPGDGPRSGE